MELLSHSASLRSAGAGVPPVSVRGVRSTPFRSALEPNIRNSRSLLIDSCPCVLFPDTLIPGAAYEASLRVQSERSGGVPPLSIRGVRSTPFRSALEPNIYYSRSLLIDSCAGVLFPDTLIPGAAYEASLRVQSERSERLRELPSAGTHRELTPAARRRGRYFIDRCGFYSDVT